VGNWLGCNIPSDFGCEWLTHPLPQVVLTSSKRDALTFEAKLLMRFALAGDVALLACVSRRGFELGLDRRCGRYDR
jgi:hypothetical protein